MLSRNDTPLYFRGDEVANTSTGDGVNVGDEN